jgi:hypothetical protein
MKNLRQPAAAGFFCLGHVKQGKFFATSFDKYLYPR